jgi:hypothetical protein
MERSFTHPLRENVLLPSRSGRCAVRVQRFGASCGKNLNEGPCDCKDELTDPRLAALKAPSDRRLFMTTQGDDELDVWWN